MGVYIINRTIPIYKSTNFFILLFISIGLSPPCCSLYSLLCNIFFKFSNLLKFSFILVCKSWLNAPCAPLDTVIILFVSTFLKSIFTIWSFGVDISTFEAVIRSCGLVIFFACSDMGGDVVGCI